VNYPESLVSCYLLCYSQIYVISDSRFMISKYLTDSVGPVTFSAEFLICRHVRTDELIRVGLGNLLLSAESHNCCIFIFIPWLHHGRNSGVIEVTSCFVPEPTFVCRCRYPFLATAIIGGIVGYRVGRY
jgi:hypothetical protein